MRVMLLEAVEGTNNQVFELDVLTRQTIANEFMNAASRGAASTATKLYSSCTPSSSTTCIALSKAHTCRADKDDGSKDCLALFANTCQPSGRDHGFELDKALSYERPPASKPQGAKSSGCGEMSDKFPPIRSWAILHCLGPATYSCLPASGSAGHGAQFAACNVTNQALQPSRRKRACRWCNLLASASPAHITFYGSDGGEATLSCAWETGPGRIHAEAKPITAKASIRGHAAAAG